MKNSSRRCVNLFIIPLAGLFLFALVPVHPKLFDGTPASLLLAAQTPPSRTTKSLPHTCININTATVEELMRLPGIGKATAKRIVQLRERNGLFRRVEELLLIRGMSEKRLQQIRPYVTVVTPPALEEKGFQKEN